MHIPPETLEKLILGSDVVSKEDFDTAQAEAQRSSRSVVDILLDKKLISEAYLSEVLQPYFGVPFIKLQGMAIPMETLGRISESFAKTHKVALFEWDKEKRVAKVAMTDPLDMATIETLRFQLDAWVEPYYALPSDLASVFKEYKKEVGKEFSKVISENIEKSLLLTGETNLSKLAEAVPIITILNTLIEHAFSFNASDIHFEPLNNEVLIRYRVDGVMREVFSLPKQIAPLIVARVKVMASLQIDEHRVPQDGRFRAELATGASLDVRVNVMPVFNGEKVEMRLLKTGMRLIDLRDLGFSAHGVEEIKKEIKKPHGMILVTGPTGHGKTTTLYSILHILNRPEVNITTIEDPIEYEIERVNQTQVNAKAGVTFANGLRALLRQNPDIIMIGEIRDSETVDIAIHSALTGHLVLSSLHTNDAPSALPRLLDMGAQAFLLSSTVNVVVAQRLVRRICTKCVESYKVSPEVKRLIAGQIKLAGDTHIKYAPSVLYKGKGCPVCGFSGFTGQVGIFEILSVTESIRDLILRQASVTEIRKTAIKDGMETMLEDGLKKVESGVTTIDEVLRVVRE